MPVNKAMVGRPREFDQEKALESAMLVFWQKGYERASVSDLLKAMNINRGSMYSAFGDKASLFDAALLLYRERYLEPFLSILESDGLALVRIGRFFDQVIDEAQNQQSAGCMICNTLIERAHCCEKSRVAAQQFLLLLESRLHGVLVEAQAGGELRPETDVKALASFLMNTLEGLSVLGKAIMPIETIENVINTLKAMLKRC